MISRFRALLIVGAGVLSVTAYLVQEWSLDRYGLVLDLPEWLWVQLAAGWVFLVAGLLADSRRPDTRIGSWLILFGMVWIGRLVFTAPMVQWEAIGWGFSLYGLLFVIVFALPTGRLRGWERWAAGTWLTFILGTAVVMVAFTDFYESVDDPVCCPSHLLLISHDSGVARAVATPALTLAMVAFVAVIAFQARRWLRASRAGRRSLASVSVALVPFFVLLVFVPATRLMSGGLDGLIEGLWSDPGGFSPVPQPDRLNLYVQNVALMVVPVLILVQLLGGRLSRARVADLMQAVHSYAGPQELERHLRNALADPDARLAFWREESGGYVDVTGQPLEVAADAAAVTSLGDRVAIVHDLSLDRDLVSAAGAGARLALNNARLQAELRAQLLEVQESRRRLVTATDEARRKVERDLHDGAQQRLIALSATLKQAAGDRSRLDPEIESLLSVAAREADGAIDELRDLARGVHPAILTQAGLGPAISSLADRAPIPVGVVAPPDRYPAEIEATAYFVVAEALSNAFKHSRAGTVTVDIREEEDGLTVRIGDDGTGGADPDGSGLGSLRDRVGSVGGWLTVAGHPGGGTAVTAWLPLAAGED